MISAIIIICLVSLTPLPSLPLVIYYYSKFGFVDGFIVLMIATNLKVIIHYKIGQLLRIKKLNFFNLQEKISRAKEKYKRIKSKDILLIRLSNLFVTRILNIFLGFINYSLRKTFLINNISTIPWQFLYFYFATKIDFLSEILINFGIDLSIVKFLSIISITSLAVLIIRILIKVLKKLNLIKFLENIISGL